MLKKYLIGASLALITSLSSTARAQDDAIARGSFEIIPPVGVADPGVSAPDLEVGFSTLRAAAKAPFVLDGGRTILLPGVAYGLTLVRLNNTAADDPDPFHEIYVEFAVVRRITGTWSLVGRVQPGLATTFEDVDSDHVRLQAQVLAMRRASQSLTYGVGLSASYLFGRILPIPLVAFDWHATPSIRIRGTLPSTVRAGYSLARRFEVGVEGQLDGNRYTARDPEQPLVESVKYTVADAGAFVGVNLFSDFWLTGYAGGTLLRQFDVRDDDDNRIAETDVDPAPVIRIGLELSPGRS